MQVRPGLVMRNSTAPAWQVLLLDFKVEWPLSLVVARRQLLQYQVGPPGPWGPRALALEAGARCVSWLPA
jgi:hypothetical protein